MPTSDAVQLALAGVIDPLLGQNLVDLGLVNELRMGREGRVLVQLLLPSRHWPGTEALSAQVRAAVASLPDVAAVEVQWTADPAWTPHQLVLELKSPLNLSTAEPATPTRPSLLRRLLGR